MEIKIPQIYALYYTGFSGAGCDNFFSGIPYRNVAVNTPHVPRKKKLKQKEEKPNFRAISLVRYVTYYIGHAKEGVKGLGHSSP